MGQEQVLRQERRRADRAGVGRCRRRHRPNRSPRPAPRCSSAVREASAATAEAASPGPRRPDPHRPGTPPPPLRRPQPPHSDPWLAARAGFDRPILHGLCTYGITGRALLHEVCDSRPASFGSMSARFSSPVLPGPSLDVHVWDQGGVFMFQTRVGELLFLTGGLHEEELNWGGRARGASHAPHCPGLRGGPRQGRTVAHTVTGCASTRALAAHSPSSS
ncbi:MaoC/PaaZ C-terminal domain-containing protein [Streptomyces sp. L7]